MKKLLSILTIVIAGQLSAQAPPPPGPPPGVVEPQFPGGEAAYRKYLQDSIRYPQDEKQRGISGTVMVSFAVNTNGKISDAKVVTGVPNGAGLDAEALRVIAAMPDWTPATYQGTPAKVYIAQPVKFTLPDEQASAPTVVAVKPRGDTLRNDTDACLTFVEVMPSFPGGQEAFTKYLQENIKYPKEEKRNGKDGTVYVKFIINKDGSVDSVQVIKSVEGAPGLGEEAVRVISAMPNWTPGTMNGRAVRVYMTVPIKFTLAGTKKKKTR